MIKEDFNVNYDTAGVDYEYGTTTNQDYNYDTMDDTMDYNYDTMDDTMDDESSPGRDIKMEVVNSRLTDWEHGPPLKITDHDFKNFFHQNHLSKN